MIMIYLFIGFIYSLTAVMMNIRLWKQDIWPDYGEYSILKKILFALFDWILWPISIASDITRTITMLLIM